MRWHGGVWLTPFNFIYFLQCVVVVAVAAIGFVNNTFHNVVVGVVIIPLF